MENVPAHVNAPATAGRQNGSHLPTSGPRAKKDKIKRAIIAGAAAVLVILVVSAAWFVYRSSTAATINGGEYQAVFFTNGQVYFGKLSSLNSGYMKLTDIYYLQAQTNSKNSENPQQTSNSSSDVQLIKLGNEVHGPEDEMIISKDQILFFENLKKDGKVADSINKYQSQKK